MTAFIKVAQSNAATFSNALDNDMLIYPSSNSQRILIGTSNVASLLIDSNNVTITGDFNFTGGIFQNGIPFTTGGVSLGNLVGIGFTQGTGCNIYILGCNIGINKTAPTANLDVQGNLNVSQTLSIDGDVVVQGVDMVNNPGAFANISPSNLIATSNSSYSNDLLGLNFYSSNYFRFMGGSNESVRIQPNSFVGVGKTNSSYTLDVIGDINLSGILRSNNSPYTNSQWSNNTSNVYILSNIGINKSNPSVTLDILGNANISSNITLTGTTSMQGVNINSNIIVNSNASSVYGFSNDTNGINFIMLSNTNNNYVKFLNSNTELIRIRGDGSIIPGTSLVSDLGSSNFRFRDIYLSSNTINISSTKLSHDPLSGTFKVLDQNNNLSTLVASNISINNSLNINSTNFTNITLASNNYLYDSNNLTLLALYNTWHFISAHGIFTPPLQCECINNTQGGFVSLDSANNMYIAGYYNNSNIVIYNSNSIASTLAMPSNDKYAYLVQYNSNGIANWNINISKAIANSISIDSGSNIFITGIYNSNSTVYNPVSLCNTSVSSLIYASNTSGFIAKYNSNGVALWTNNITNGSLNSCTIDLSNNLFCSGASSNNSLIYDTNSNTNKTSSFLSAYANVSTVAGTGTATFLDSSNLLASFNYPRGICMDSLGNIYVADASNNRIRKITNQVVTTLAGSGTATYFDGLGTNAGFNYPEGICLDSNGNLYVADSSNNRIRKIVGGLVTTLAGSGTATYLDATGTNAGFNGPRGIGIDTFNNLYISDTFNNRIRLLNTNGVVSTYAGNGTAALTNSTGTNAAFNTPKMLTIDNSNNIYVADTSNNVVRLINTSQVVSTYITGLNNPTGVVIDLSRNVYVADTGNHLIKIMNTSGTLCNLAGSGTATYLDGTGTNPGFNAPTGLCVDLNGNIYVSDTSNNRIRRIETAGAYFITYGSNAGYSDGIGALSSFNNLSGIALDNVGNLYIADSANNRIRKITGSTVTTFAGTGTATYLDGIGTNASFNNPMGLAIDSSNNLYISDTSNNRIRKITGNVVTTLAGSGTATILNGASNIAGFNSPIGICLDSSNNLYVADTNNNIIRMLSNGIVTTFAGTGTATYLDGNSNIAGFNYPCGIIVDTSNNLYCADTSNNRIRKVITGVVSTLAGSGTATYLDGFGTLASFNNPNNITIDNNGVIYISDTKNNLLRKIIGFNNVSTIAGSPSLYAFAINQSVTFTNAGATGPNGPTLSQCQSAYSGYSWISNPNFFNTSNGIQFWAVPVSGVYTITAAGAYGAQAINVGTGAANGGFGLITTSTFSLPSGLILKMLVGQQGITVPMLQVPAFSSSASGGGGGGGTFVCANGTNSIFLIAGGGGGAMTAYLTISGTLYTYVRPGINAPYSIQATNGNGTPNTAINGGGGTDAGNGDCGAGGYSGNGTNNRGTNSFGYSFLNGGAGGTSTYTISSTFYGYGGFGGGGAPYGLSTYIFNGGGGGYNGGDGGLPGGAGSYYSTGINNINVGTNPGMGYVTIKRIS
jgi:sugar lactone lactonase YvrE